MTYVVYDTDTGWSDESMRFATLDEATHYIAMHDGLYAIRHEE